MSGAHGDYTVGGDYNISRESPWKALGGEHRQFEYHLLYLLQADKELKELWYSDLQGLSEKQGLRLDRGIDNLDEVLLGAYAHAPEFFKDHPNPQLLKAMLAHYYLYVNSAREAWPSVIGTLSKIDETLARQVRKEAKPKWPQSKTEKHHP